MVQFRLLHISDLHFGSPESHQTTLSGDVRVRTVIRVLAQIIQTGSLQGVRSSTFEPEVAITLLRLLATLVSDVDAFVITGDLATTGCDEDLGMARDFFEGTFASEVFPDSEPLPSLLSKSDSVVLCLPGNHDRYEGLLAQPVSASFEKFFGSNWDFERGNCFDILGMIGNKRVRTCVLEKNGSYLAIVMADLSLEGSWSGEGLAGYVGQGRAYSEVVRALLDATASIRSTSVERSVPIGVVWAVHYPPNFPGIAQNMRLIDDSVLVDAAASARVNIILAGHTHQAGRYSTGADHVEVLCCGASSGLSDNGQFSFLDIDISVSPSGVATVASVGSVNWDWDEKSFLDSTPLPTISA